MGEIGTIYSLNYEPEIEAGFVSKVIVRLLDRKYEAFDLLYNRKQYDLNRVKRFGDDYIQAIDDVFFYINNRHPDLETEHSRFGRIRFRDCYFGIDVLDPPATPISLYSGDSAGVAIFLSLVSAFLEIPIRDNTAVTGSLRSKYSTDIGLVGDIIGKLSVILNIHNKFDMIIIPDIEYLRDQEFINQDDVSDILDKYRALVEGHHESVVLCKKAHQCLKYIFGAFSDEGLSNMGRVMGIFGWSQDELNEDIMRINSSWVSSSNFLIYSFREVHRRMFDEQFD